MKKLFAILSLCCLFFACNTSIKKMEVEEEKKILEKTTENNSQNQQRSAPPQLADGDCFGCCSGYADSGYWKQICPECGCTTPWKDICGMRGVADIKNDTSILEYHDKLRAFWETSNTTMGKDIYRCYYNHTKQSRDIILANPNLIDEAYNLIGDLVPFAKDFILFENQIIISQDIVNKINNFVNEIVKDTPLSSKIREDFNIILQRMRINSLVGLKTQEAWNRIKNN